MELRFKNGQWTELAQDLGIRLASPSELLGSFNQH